MSSKKAHRRFHNNLTDLPNNVDPIEVKKLLAEVVEKLKSLPASLVVTVAIAQPSGDVDGSSNTFMCTEGIPSHAKGKNPPMEVMNALVGLFVAQIDAMVDEVAGGYINPSFADILDMAAKRIRHMGCEEPVFDTDRKPSNC